jgi:hypothetical protein
MEPVQFNCPLCAGLFQIDPAMAGGEVLCPNCQGTVTIPAMSAPPPSVPPPAATAQELSCPLCTGVFQVTPDMAGQQVSCPHCTGLVMIPTQSDPHSVPAPPTGEVVAPVPFTPPPPEPPIESPVNVAPQTVAPVNVPQPASPGPAPEPVTNPPSPVSGEPSPSRNFYPPGFEPKTAEPEQKTKTEPAPAAPQFDPRYPPGQAPKTTSQPQDVTAKKTSNVTPAAPSQPSQPTQLSQPAKGIDSLLPPGAAGPTSPPQETTSPVDAKVDAMLPPGGASTESSPKKQSKADALLPPGADTKPEKSDLKQKALPENAENRPIKANKDIVIQTEDGGVATLHEPEKTVIGHGGSQVHLRTLTAEEKTRKRSLKSLVMWVICVAVLVGALIVLVNS